MCLCVLSLLQIGGIAPTPSVLKEKTMMANIFHIKNHMITYPISATHSSWA
jgi:salicylate hydroxylase